MWTDARVQKGRRPRSEKVFEGSLSRPLPAHKSIVEGEQRIMPCNMEPSQKWRRKVSMVVLWCGALPFSWYVSGWTPVQQGLHPGTSHEKEDPRRNMTTELVACPPRSYSDPRERAEAGRMRFTDAPVSSYARRPPKVVGIRRGGGATVSRQPVASDG